jgi:hypothetical protein
MVRTVGVYAPAGMGITSGFDSTVRFDLRIMTRTGETVVDFGEFKDLLSYNDTLSVESPAGSWNLKMRARLDNETLLKRIHPGMVIEVYASRNQDPLTDVEAFIPQDPATNPVVFQTADGSGSNLSDAYAPADGQPKPPPEPDWEDYLDKAPYLLMRGITSAYGRSSAVMGGGTETTLTLSGESYGAIYRNAQVLTDTNAPTSLGRSLEVRFQTVDVNTVVPIYYGILRHWVEQFWFDPADGQGETGWEARTRPIPIPPDVFARIANEGSAWSALQYLTVNGIFQMFVDHTGAIVWEKLPYSGRCQTVLDSEYLKWSDRPLRNWEDLPFVQCPSSSIIAWADRLSCDRIANYVRCTLQGQMGASAGDTAMDAGQCYNMGSIKQYGGPRKMEIAIPARLVNSGNKDIDIERDGRASTFMDLIALEVIRWYDRPVQRCTLSVRGEPGWRINTCVEVTENWHNPEAVPGQYLILSRSHSIELASGSWTTQLECLRDRRNRYLGAGLTEDRDQLGGDGEVNPERASGPVSTDEELEDFISPIEPDFYYWYNRKGNRMEAIGGAEEYNALIQEYLPEECKA